MTSHDVVNVVRKIAGTRRVGHAGTLDPLATGVLILCVGQATRISEYLMASRKVYRATVKFGVATDTYDAEGSITEQSPTDHLTEAALRESLSRFVGVIEQRVPPFSAVKKEGEPLYRKARRGEEVDAPVREVEVYRAGLLAWEPPLATIEVVCGPGTYIRSLAHDWGQAIGTGAHLQALVRLASGRFTIDNAVPLDELREAGAEGYWDHHLLPTDEGLLDMDAVIVTREQAHALRHGQGIEKGTGSDGQIVRAYTMAGEFIALARYDAESGLWMPHKVFAAA